MRFHETYVRGTFPGSVPQEEIRALAAMVTAEPVEVVLSGRGASRRGHLLPTGSLAAAALARRNIHSLLARRPNPAEAAESLAAALTAPPREAEDALEDGYLEFNLRYSIFATHDAMIELNGRALRIHNGQTPSVSIERRVLRDEGTALFGSLAMARLVSLDVDLLQIAPSAIVAKELQFEPGGLMLPNTGRTGLPKGDYHRERKPDFMKEFCVSCGRCFVHCPDNAIIHSMFDENAADTTGILGIDYDRCTACGLCAAVCPIREEGHKAIVMVGSDANGGVAEEHRVAST